MAKQRINLKVFILNQCLFLIFEQCVAIGGGRNSFIDLSLGIIRHRVNNKRSGIPKFATH